MLSARTTGLTIVAMIAFAANSVLCRLALGTHLIDAASFTTIRLASGAAILGLVLVARRRPLAAAASPLAVAALFVYMVLFSFAYLSLSAGSGALILFGAVQLTMFTVALGRGERFSPLSWAGLLMAIAGLVYLVSPGVTAPDPVGALLMAVAGIAWGTYSLLGRSTVDATAATASNFIYAVPAALLVSLLFSGSITITGAGASLAVASGALASGIGYVLWYAALPGLRATTAATVQLSVPAIAAIGGVVLLAEDVTLRLVAASLVTLGGVAIVLRRGAAGTQESGRS